MSTTVNAIGAAGFGMFYGYVTLYILKRYLPPLSQDAPKIKELISALLALAAGGAMGAMVRSIDGINFIGAYGIGLVLGTMLNVAVTIWLGFNSNKA
jgi:hypothetical protein